MSNLVTTWIESQLTPGKSIKQICTELGDAVGMVVTSSRLREWEKAQRGLPAPIHNYMLKAALVAALEEEGVLPDGVGAMERLTAKLTLPVA